MHAKVWKTVFQEMSFGTDLLCLLCESWNLVFLVLETFTSLTLSVASSFELTVFFSLPRILKLCTLIDDIQEHFTQTDGRIICLFPYFLSLSIKYRNLAILIGIRKNSAVSYDVFRFADDISIKSKHATSRVNVR